MNQMSGLIGDCRRDTTVCMSYRGHAESRGEVQVNVSIDICNQTVLRGLPEDGKATLSIDKGNIWAFPMMQIL
jgi:hypothetical protein